MRPRLRVRNVDRFAAVYVSEREKQPYHQGCVPQWASTVYRAGGGGSGLNSHYERCARDRAATIMLCDIIVRTMCRLFVVSIFMFVFIKTSTLASNLHMNRLCAFWNFHWNPLRITGNHHH